MPRMMLTHRHTPAECVVAFAAWRGFESPLRHRAATASCRARDGSRDHLIVWQVEAASEREALRMLPPYVAERTEVSEVCEVGIP